MQEKCGMERQRTDQWPVPMTNAAVPVPCAARCSETPPSASVLEKSASVLTVERWERRVERRD